MRSEDAFEDDNPLCYWTSSALRITSTSLTPGEITEALEIQPSWAIEKGKRPWSIWLLRADGRVVSRDVRRHVAWILDQIIPRSRAIITLQARGAEMRMYNLWESALGQGGPSLFASQMKQLGELGIEIGWEIYLLGPWLDVTLSQSDGVRMIIVGDRQGFKEVGERLREGFEQYFTGSECAVRLVNRSDEDECHTSMERGLFVWRMTPDEMITVSSSFLNLAQVDDGPLYVEITPRLNESGVKIFAVLNASKNLEQQE